MSLAESTISVMLPITEPTRAQEFYGERLELPFDGKDGEGSLMFRLGGGAELVLRPLAAGQQSTNTAMSFEVGDLPAEIARLEGRGCASRTTTSPASPPWTTSSRAAASGRPGSSTRTATCSACTRPTGPDQSSGRYITCSPTRPCAAERNAPGTVPTTTKPQ